MSYKHDAIVRAWLDGKTIQAKGADGKWHDYAFTVATAYEVPWFSVSSTFRIKPEPVVVRYFRIDPEGPSQMFTCAPNFEQYVNSTSNSKVVWVDTEWQEYIVDES